MAVPIPKEAPSAPEPATSQSPALRNAIHFGAFVLFAGPLGALVDPRNKVAHGRSIVVGFLAFVTLLNLFLMPHVSTGKRILWTGEKLITGVALYPFSLMLCFMFFPPFAAMGAWGAMAAGDAAAAFFGRALPWPMLPWNKQKTWTGLLAFILVSMPFCYAAIYWCPSQQFLKTDLSPELPFVWTLAILAAVSGAIFETLHSRIDDNLRVPLGVAAVLWLSGKFLSFSTRDLPAATFVQPEFFPRALFVNAALGTAVLLCRFADLAGVAGGVIVGTLIFFFTGWQGYLLFAAFVVFGSLLSKTGRQRKRLLGTEEAREGKRGLGNVAANLLVPALCCLAFPASGGNGLWLIAYAGAIAAAFADTASSEIGTLSIAPPWLITNFKAVPHGTNGAVSALGFLAAINACLMIAALGWAGGFFGLLLDNVFHLKVTTANLVWMSASVILAGLGGTLVDSLLGATLEDRVPGFGKGAVNFACTLSGAALAGGGLWALLNLSLMN